MLPPRIHPSTTSAPSTTGMPSTATPRRATRSPGRLTGGRRWSEESEGRRSDLHHLGFLLLQHLLDAVRVAMRELVELVELTMPFVLADLVLLHLLLHLVPRVLPGV